MGWEFETGFDRSKKVGGTRYLSDFGQTGGKKGAARWEPGDAPNDVLRVGARVAKAIGRVADIGRVA